LVHRLFVLLGTFILILVFRAFLVSS